MLSIRQWEAFCQYIGEAPAIIRSNHFKREGDYRREFLCAPWWSPRRCNNSIANPFFGMPFLRTSTFLKTYSLEFINSAEFSMRIISRRWEGKDNEPFCNRVQEKQSHTTQHNKHCSQNFTYCWWLLLMTYCSEGLGSGNANKRLLIFPN